MDVKFEIVIEQKYLILDLVFSLKRYLQFTIYRLI